MMSRCRHGEEPSCWRCRVASARRSAQAVPATNPHAELLDDLRDDDTDDFPPLRWENGHPVYDGPLTGDDIPTPMTPGSPT